ncbi:MAG: hypothetical protein LBV29_05015, partial [Azoarcus sp.]|nr:hypothetical protein [Azoarcus sp.]
MPNDPAGAPSNWFIQKKTFGYRNCTFKMLNCGEAAFGELYRAIQKAERSISYICWAFQPSMYFERDGKAPCIGELLEEKARQGVKVRVLCWGFLNLSAINLPGLLGEARTPGRSAGGIADRP